MKAVPHAQDEDALAWLREHRGAALLSSLALTDDDDAALERFAERLPSGARTIADLRAAKGLVTALCDAMLSKHPADWAAISRAHDALGRSSSGTGTLRGAPAPAPAPPADAESMVASQRGEAACFPLAVHDYATLVVRSQNATPDQLAQLYDEFGVEGSDHHKRIDQVFSAAFAQDANLRTQFTRALRECARPD